METPGATVVGAYPQLRHTFDGEHDAEPVEVLLVLEVVEVVDEVEEVDVEEVDEVVVVDV